MQTNLQKTLREWFLFIVLHCCFLVATAISYWGVTIHTPFDLILFWLSPFKFEYFNLINVQMF